MKVDSTSKDLDDLLEDTSYVYTEVESLMAGMAVVLLAIGGSFLNFILIAAIVRCPELRKEYIAPSVVSIAI